METTTAVLDRETTRQFSSPAPERRTQRLTPVFGLMAAGVATVGLAIGILVTAQDGGEQGAPQPPAAESGGAAPAAAPSGLTIQSTGDISVLNMTYEPGQSSGWHTHRGIHAVALVAGEVTVYDQNCVAHTYGLNEPYIGGQQLHLLRNEGAEPAVMVVTYVNPINPEPAQVSTTPRCDVR